MLKKPPADETKNGFNGGFWLFWLNQKQFYGFFDPKNQFCLKATASLSIQRPAVWRTSTRTCSKLEGLLVIALERRFVLVLILLILFVDF